MRCDVSCPINTVDTAHNFKEEGEKQAGVVNGKE
jgi:hypothetical protein